MLPSSLMLCCDQQVKSSQHRVAWGSLCVLAVAAGASPTAPRHHLKILKNTATALQPNSFQPTSDGLQPTGASLLRSNFRRH